MIKLAKQLCVCCLLFVSSGSMGSGCPQVQLETRCGMLQPCERRTSGPLVGQGYMDIRIGVGF